jgi:hypothetical protein
MQEILDVLSQRWTDLLAHRRPDCSPSKHAAPAPPPRETTS